ncbi:DUF554 domain-containing protein [Desulfallas thermosapovorans]|uniref:Membrane protein YdfK n=1 Tax=Desulfallas thermosapovorans DSM 6562 TaxID=1121431 RepID=A0A5S4ZTW9_9FIRM|nr:DUF554 domain-containing protein [Desulfallas thermosapovorans]TYO96427.1 hypothetical protein LX24_00892 [Desulfallas thermosapovorans DSM 6562]
MLGTIVNVLAICAGAIAGLVLKKGIKPSVKKTVMQAIGLSVLLVGLQMSLQSNQIILVIISLALGGISGELLKIEDNLHRLGLWLQNLVGKKSGDIASAFVTTSLIYCVGAMAIVGAIEDGLTGNPNTLFTKAILDGVSAIFFASTMGIGVIFSCIPVLIYQGTITLTASFLKDILNPFVINQLTATGGLLIVGIAINILELKKINTGNLLPAIIIIVPLSYIVKNLNLV